MMSKISYSFNFKKNTNKSYTVTSSGKKATVAFVDDHDSNGQVPSFKIDLGNSNWFYFSIGEVNYPPPRASYGANAKFLTLKSTPGISSQNKNKKDSIEIGNDEMDILEDEFEMFGAKYVPPITYWIIKLDISFELETKSNPPNKIITNLIINAQFNTGKDLRTTSQIFPDSGNSNMLYFRINYNPSYGTNVRIHNFTNKIYANHVYPIIITDENCEPSQRSQYDSISHFSSFIFKIK